MRISRAVRAIRLPSTRVGRRSVVVGLAVGAFVVPAGASYALWSATATGTLAVSTGACAPGSSTVLAASADAWIDQANPSVNNGSDSALYVASQSGSRNRRALVKFTLPTVPTSCSLSSVILTLYNQSPGSGRTIDVFRANAAWVESTVRWTGAPGTTGTAVGSVTPGSAGLQSWDVTTHAIAQYMGPNNGFILRDRTESASSAATQNYRSRDATPSPSLTVNWS